MQSICSLNLMKPLNREGTNADNLHGTNVLNFPLVLIGSLSNPGLNCNLGAYSLYNLSIYQFISEKNTIYKFISTIYFLKKKLVTIDIRI